MSYVIGGILIVCVVGYFYRKSNKKSPCCSETKQNDLTDETKKTKKTEEVEEVEEVEELKNVVESTGEIKIIGEIKSADEKSQKKLEREIKKINFKKLDVTVENLPDIIEMYRPKEVTMETIKSFAKDIYNKQVEPLAYPTIYKYIADFYGYRTWQAFKKDLETK